MTMDANNTTGSFSLNLSTGRLKAAANRLSDDDPERINVGISEEQLYTLVDDDVLEVEPRGRDATVRVVITEGEETITDALNRIGGGDDA